MGNIASMFSVSNPVIEWWIGVHINTRETYERLISCVDSMLTNVSIPIRMSISTTTEMHKQCNSLAKRWVESMAYFHSAVAPYTDRDYVRTLYTSTKQLSLMKAPMYIAWSNGTGLYSPLYIQHFYESYLAAPDLDAYYSQWLCRNPRPKDTFADAYTDKDSNHIATQQRTQTGIFPWRSVLNTTGNSHRGTNISVYCDFINAEES
jgi:hypothetical protein